MGSWSLDTVQPGVCGGFLKIKNKKRFFNRSKRQRERFLCIRHIFIFLQLKPSAQVINRCLCMYLCILSVSFIDDRENGHFFGTDTFRHIVWSKNVRSFTHEGPQLTIYMFRLSMSFGKMCLLIFRSIYF